MLENRDGEDVGREKGGYGEFWIENITVRFQNLISRSRKCREIKGLELLFLIWESEEIRLFVLKNKNK